MAVTEMALTGSIGASIVAQAFAGSGSLVGQMFGEGQSRYLIAGNDHTDMTIAKLAQIVGVPCARIGITGGTSLIVGLNDETLAETTICDIPLATLRTAHEGFFPALMDGEL